MWWRSDRQRDWNKVYEGDIEIEFGGINRGCVYIKWGVWINRGGEGCVGFTYYSSILLTASLDLWQ